MRFMTGIIMTGMLTIALLTHCQQPLESEDNSPGDNEKNSSNQQPVALFSVPFTVTVGDCVVADGTGSLDPDGDELTYEWALVTTPSNSNAVLQNPDSSETYFIADAAGEFTVHLMVSDGTADSTAQATVTAVEDQARILEEIATDTVLENIVTDPRLPDYRAPSTVDVTAALTIEPGVRIAFGEKATMLVRTEGSIIAEGTQDSMIVLTGEESVPGYWGGLELFGSHAQENRLDYVIIEYGGGVNPDRRDGDQRANLMLNDFYEPVEIAVLHTTLRHSAVNGLYVGGDRKGVDLAFDGNTMTANAVPAHIAVNSLGEVIGGPMFYGETLKPGELLQEDNDFTGNSTDIITVYGNVVDGSQRFEDPGVPLKVVDPFAVRGTSERRTILRIWPGTELRFATGTGIQVREYGCIDLQGEASDKILLTGTRQQPGHWRGVEILESDTINYLEHVVIEYGGGGDPDQRSELHRANLMFNDFYNLVRAEIQDVTLRYSAHNGFYIGGDREGVRLPEFTEIITTANAYPGLVNINQIGELDQNISIYANTNQVIRVYGNRVDRSQTWPAVGVPFRFRESVTVNGLEEHSVSLKIQAGASFQFAEDTRLIIGDYGIFTVEGTISRPVTFTGVEQVPGYWGGIEFFGSGSALNTLEHVNVVYGGGMDIDERPGTAANLMLNDFYEPVRISIVNSMFGYSANYGIYVGGDREGLTVECSGLNFLDNTGGPTGGPETLECQ